ncbi:MAG: hypothetical protein IKJ65_11880 [Clostridia bacterium]|nr:hypothetical protein [Clostridia bacterium]
MTEFQTADENAKQRDRDEEMSAMRFRFVKIQFYPEDLKKMETMEHEEKMEYVMRLRKENRYVEVEDESE